MSFMVAQATAEPIPEPERVFPATSRRNEVLQALVDSPGSTAARIARQLGMRESEADRNLRKLAFGGQARFDGALWRAVE